MYSPRIDTELIPRLYVIAKKLKTPMTTLVNEMLTDALVHYEDQLIANGKTDINRKGEHPCIVNAVVEK